MTRRTASVCPRLVLVAALATVLSLTGSALFVRAFCGRASPLALPRPLLVREGVWGRHVTSA